MIRAIFTFLSFCLFAHMGFTQILFPGLDGNNLKNALVTNYKPAQVLDYNDARDYMFTQVDIINDTVYGIYSRHGIYLPPGTPSPRAWMFTEGGTSSGGAANAINTEHLYPRSKGATEGTNAFSDLHHLRPSKVKVNSDRGSLPFDEIPDNVTDSWYFKRTVQSNTPNMMIDSFSERTNNFFEPKEDVKGNVARALMYFFTMYENQALGEDPSFFSGMQSELCAWHEADPADAREMIRSAKVALVQDGKENPFILDCTLAKRLFCPSLMDCFSAVNEEFENLNFNLRQNGNSITITSPEENKDQSFHIRLYSVLGKTVINTEFINQLSMQIPLNNSILFFSIRSEMNQEVFSQKIIIQN